MLDSALANKKVIKAQQSGAVKKHWTAMLATPAAAVNDNKQMVGVVFYQK